MLYHRYANPIPLLDHLILYGQFSDFIDTIQQQIDEERLWDLYVNQFIKEQSFDEWRELLTKPQEGQCGKMEKKDIEATIQRSQNILTAFSPE